MILYHFTTSNYLSAIMAEGLTKGEVPLSAHIISREWVWLTSSASPVGHGLGEPGEMGQEWRAAMEHTYGMKLPSEPIFMPDKSEIRITVRISSHNRNLRPWRKLARKLRISPEWLAALHEGNKPETWYVIRPPILPSAFLAVERKQDARRASIRAGGLTGV